jgi:hypothetical protein
MIDKVSGKVASAVTSFGSFMGVVMPVRQPPRRVSSPKNQAGEASAGVKATIATGDASSGGEALQP